MECEASENGIRSVAFIEQGNGFARGNGYMTRIYGQQSMPPLSYHYNPLEIVLCEWQILFAIQ